MILHFLFLFFHASLLTLLSAIILLLKKGLSLSCWNPFYFSWLSAVFPSRNLLFLTLNMPPVVMPVVLVNGYVFLLNDSAIFGLRRSRTLSLPPLPNPSAWLSLQLLVRHSGTSTHSHSLSILFRSTFKWAIPQAST